MLVFVFVSVLVVVGGGLIVKGFVSAVVGGELPCFGSDFWRVLDTVVVVVDVDWIVTLGGMDVSVGVGVVWEVDVVGFLYLDQFHLQLVDGVIFGFQLLFHL